MSDLVRGGLADPVLVQPAQIAAVYQSRIGALLAAPLAPGHTTITVDDVDPFVDEGGSVAVETADDVAVAADPVAGTPAYVDRPVTQGVPYSRIDRTTNVITLAAAWDAAFPSFAVGDSVWVDPTVVYRLADVALDGDSAQVVTCRIPYALQTAIPEGLRIEGEGEWVTVAISDLGDGYVVTDVLGEAPVFDPTVETDPATEDVTFDTITADVVESPSVPRRNPFDRTLYVEPVAGDDDNGGEALTPLLDTFTRVGSSFGTSDSGHAWTSIVNEGNLRDTDGSSARVRLANASLNNVQRSAFAPLDVEVLTTLHISAVPTGGAGFYGVGLRIVDGTRLVAFFLQVASAGTVLPEFHVKAGGTWTESFEPGVSMGTFTTATLAAIDWKVRVQCQTNPDGGTDYRARVWRSTDPEPTDWTIGDFNDPTGSGLQSPFGVGTASRTGGSYAATTHPIASYRDFAASTLDGSGEPVDVTVGGVGPLATLAAAMALVGDWNDGDVRIILGGIIEEDLDIAGLGGGGSLTIDGGGSATLNGYVRFRGVAHYVTLRSFTIQDTGNPGPAATIDVRSGSRYVLISSMNVQTNAYRSNVIDFNEGSAGRVEDTGMHNATARGLYAVNASVVYAVDNTGSTSPTSYQASCATIFMSGSKPSNATNSTLGGQLLGSTSSNAGGSAPPPQPTKKTDTVTANKTRTWRPSWGWREDNDETYQGEYAGSGGLSRGAAFYGTKLRRSGKTAVSGKVYIKRLGSGGQSGKQDIFLATHNEESQPSSDSDSPGLINGPSRVGALGYGEGAWFTIPKGWVQDLLTGPARGLMLYHGSANPYVICLGRGNGSGIWKVTITYQ